MQPIAVSRRKVISLVGAGGAAAVAAPYISRRAFAADGELVFCSWGGSYQRILRKAFLDPFENATGIKIVDTSAPMVAQVKAQVDSKNVEWDVIEGGTRWYPVLLKQNLIQPLGLKDADIKGLLPGAALSHGAAPLMVSFVLAYNTDHFKDAQPNGWADFWDVERFPGPRSLGADVTYNLEFALLADGVPVDKLYPIDAERAFAKLAKIRDHIKVWWKQGDQPTQLLSKGEAVMSSAWCGRTIAAHTSGLPLNLTWGQGAYSPSFFMIPTGAPHRDEALGIH